MSTRSAGRIILAKGVFLVVIALAHIALGLALEPGRVADAGTLELRSHYLLYFCVSGGFFLFMGVVDVLCARGVREDDAPALRIAWACSVFTALTGVAGVSVLGVVSPPLALLLAGVVGVATLALASGARRRVPVPEAPDGGRL